MPYDLLISVAQYVMLFEVNVTSKMGCELDFIIDSTALYFNFPLPAGKIKMLYKKLNSSTSNRLYLM